MPRTLFYALLCVVVPLVWGILVARVFDWLEARRPSRRPAPPRRHRPEIDYYI